MPSAAEVVVNCTRHNGLDCIEFASVWADKVEEGRTETARIEYLVTPLRSKLTDAHLFADPDVLGLEGYVKVSEGLFRNCPG